MLLAPLWVPAALLFDAAHRGRRAAARCGAVLTFYLQCEAAGILASGAIWLLSGVWSGRGRERHLAWNFRLQVLWGTALFAGAQRIFGFALEVENAEATTGTPFLLFARHASIADTLLPVVLISAPRGTRLRYVLKRELLFDPCLDVVGNRLPNCFVDRDSDRSEVEIERVRRLAAGLPSDEGILIYPEGTRFTPRKRERALASLRKRDPDRAGWATHLTHVLPPRPGGTLALLEAAPTADCVFCAHTGLEGAGRLSDLWRGALVGARVRVAFWRIPRAEIPTARDARASWLDAQWQAVDAWIAKHGAA